MDFLSDTTRKERRNLLAAGFAGIIVAQLKIYPTAIDVVGLKFQSSELPLIANGGLCVAITYFLIKFWSSYLYEQSSATTEALATQIQEGKTEMDISREEEALNESLRQLIDQRKRLQIQQDNEEKRIAGIQHKINKDDIAHELTLKALDQRKLAFDQELSGMDQYLTKGKAIPRFMYPNTREVVEFQIKKLEEERALYLRQREATRQNDVQNLENEKKNRAEVYEAQVRKLDSDEEAAKEKRTSILEWRRVHTTVGWISPLHRFLELYLPILVGMIAIGSLIFLMLHFPPPKPPSFPPL